MASPIWAMAHATLIWLATKLVWRPHALRRASVNFFAGLGVPAFLVLALSACSSSGFAGIYDPSADVSATQARAGHADAPNAGNRANSTAPPLVIDEATAANPAGLATAEVRALMAGGPSGSLRWLYPYEGTVFPRGTLPPTLMWEGPVPDAVYLHIQSSDFEYKGALKPAAEIPLQAPLGVGPLVAASAAVAPQPQLPIPQRVWDKACERTRGKLDTVTLQLTTLVAGQAAGPIDLHIRIAQATLKSSVYYNSYQTEVGAPGLASYVSGGKVLRIPPGGKAELVTAADRCTGCHSVSANGARMIAQQSDYGTPMLDAAGNLILTGSAVPGGLGQSYALGSGSPPVPGSGGARASFGALYPDGSKYLATALLTDIGGQALYEPQGTTATATLYDLERGLPVAGADVPPSALMPMFSPDGTRLVFNDFAIESAHGLAVMDYDVHADRASNYQVLVKWPSAEPSRPGFPVFLPDNRAVIYLKSQSPDFTGTRALGSARSGQALQPGASMTPETDRVQLPLSDLYIVDVTAQHNTLLARAMGFDTPALAESDTTYLPFGPSELHHNYFPTVSPVAAGGFFWVFFDSLRHYGNLGSQRQLWGAAIDIESSDDYTRDPSYPAFYLPGQNLGDSNHRAFAALEPCRSEGNRCDSGIDCCSGTCSVETLTCGPRSEACALLDERCVQTEDCCSAQPDHAVHLCIAGFCAFVDLL